MRTPIQQKMLNMVITLWGYRVDEVEKDFINELNSNDNIIPEGKWNQLVTLNNKYQQLYPGEVEGYLFTL